MSAPSMDVQEGDRLLAEALQRAEYGDPVEDDSSLNETLRRFETSIYDLDEDRKLAEQLQREEEEEYRALEKEILDKQPTPKAPEHVEQFRALLESNKHLSIVDPQWETLDPTPDVSAMFQVFDDVFFGKALRFCTVSWSPRMTSCAGLCCYKAGSCSIRLSRPLLTLRPRSDLVETLLHEMIHAFIFMTGKFRSEGRDGHGPEFHRHMNRINANAGCKITVYHTFHDEVRFYKVHHWRCDGPCRDRAPFFGWVKRSRNCAPSKNDFWWAKHQQTCGGTFIKVAGPEPQPKGAKGKAKAVGNNRKRKDPPFASQADGPLAKLLKKSQTSAVPTDKKAEPATKKTITNGVLSKVTGSKGRSGGSPPSPLTSPPSGSSKSKTSPNTSNFKAFKGTGHKLGSGPGSSSGQSILIEGSSQKRSVVLPQGDRLRQATLENLLPGPSGISSTKKKGPSARDLRLCRKVILEIFSSDEEDPPEPKTSRDDVQVTPEVKVKPEVKVTPEAKVKPNLVDSGHGSPSGSRQSTVPKPTQIRGTGREEETILIDDAEDDDVGKPAGNPQKSGVGKTSCVDCPVCMSSVPAACINAHLDRCLRP